MRTHLNVEIKARCRGPEDVLRRLTELGAKAEGIDHQVDTYFRAANGRLKLRTGNIENALIHYSRPDQPGPTESHVTLYATSKDDTLGALLRGALEVLVVVHKRRQILWIDNVKFHVDDVVGLGSFVEIEAIDQTDTLGQRVLLEQCQGYTAKLAISNEDLEPRSYCDLLLDGAC